MRLLNGQIFAEKTILRIKQEIALLKNRKPGLAFVLVGDNPASQIYIRMKKKKCQEVGIASFDREFPATISEKELLEEIQKLNKDPEIDGILIQLPLPPHLSSYKILESLDFRKDVDGFHPMNMGKLLLGDHDGFIPCTPHGIQTLLAHAEIPLIGKHVVIVGRSNIVGKPLAALLMQKHSSGNATVTVAHSLSENLATICRSADILVAALGKPEFIKKSMVKPGAVVIDVGINKTLGSNKIVGDVAFEEVSSVCSAITPVPGGIGPMTIAMLLSNTLLSFEHKTRIKK